MSGFWIWSSDSDHEGLRGHLKIMMVQQLIQHVPQAVDFRWPSKLIDPIFPACPEPVSGSPPFRECFNHLI